MKHLFIVNPISGGKKHDPRETERKIKDAIRDINDQCEIYFTTAPKDACRKIDQEAEKNDRLRVYACGGDGTLNECVNAAVKHKNVAITQYPCGTGNDFVRVFGDDAEKFRDVKALVEGKEHKIDVIKCGDMYGVNICSVGIDARIGTEVHKYSKIPIIGGATGYVVSLVINVLKGINSVFKIKTKDMEETGRHALICACNGRFYGGGFNPVPDAMIDDGLMDILVICEVSFSMLLRLLGKYAKGKYKELSQYIKHIRTDKIEISSPEKFVINIDGEAVYTDCMSFELIPGALSFISPEGVNYWGDK